MIASLCSGSVDALLLIVASRGINSSFKWSCPSVCSCSLHINSFVERMNIYQEIWWLYVGHFWWRFSVIWRPSRAIKSRWPCNRIRLLFFLLSSHLIWTKPNPRATRTSLPSWAPQIVEVWHNRAMMIRGFKRWRTHPSGVTQGHANGCII